MEHIDRILALIDGVLEETEAVADAIATRAAVRDLGYTGPFAETVLPAAAALR